MAKINQTEVLGRIIELLTPLASDDRHRIVNASLTFLGEHRGGAKGLQEEGQDQDSGDDLGLAPRAGMWRKQSGITPEQLQQVFHVSDGKVDVIASEIPGASTKERTVNAYVLAGLAKYLATGDPKFDDKSARSVCSTSGCYDNTNHATYLKARGNLFAGTKDAGWSLTTPGLRHAAELVKTLTRAQQ
jgi:hypothetical protein